MRLSPMLEILKKADWINQVKEWAGNSGQSQIYEILYMGRRAFQTEEGLQYIEGNAKEQEGYGVPTGNEVFNSLEMAAKSSDLRCLFICRRWRV